MSKTDALMIADAHECESLADFWMVVQGKVSKNEAKTLWEAISNGG